MVHRQNPAQEATSVRVTQVLLDEDGHWKLASIHLSPIADGA